MARQSAGSQLVRLGAVGCAALGALAAPGTATAAEPAPAALSLSWASAPGCPDREAVELKVRSLLGSSPPASEAIAAAGVVTRAPEGGFSLVLETTQRGQTHQRTLTAPTCAELSDAGALIVALAVDPKLVLPASPAQDASTQDPAAPSTGLPADPEPIPAPPLEPPPPRVTPAPALPRSDAGWPFELRVSAGALGDAGTLPRPSAGVSLGAGLALDLFRVDVLGHWLPAVRHVTAQTPERGGTVLLVAGGLRACVSPLRGAVELGACVGLEAGALEAASFNATEYDDEGRSAWFAGRTGVSGRLLLSRSVLLALDLEALVPAIRPQFVIERVGTDRTDLVHQPAPVVGRLTVGAELAFF